jgi:hypothetical protein
MLTQKQVQDALPANLRSAASQELVDRLNTCVTDPIAAETIRENFIGYTHILRDGRFKTEDYLSAVTYVSFKLMGYSNQESYEKTFPQRFQLLIQKGTSAKDISAYVSAYHKGKLVGLLLEQTLTPSWVLNQDYFQRAINVQADLMLNANSEKVRSDAANSLLTHLKKPEGKDFQVSIELTDNSGMKDMQEALRKLALAQQNLIAGGVSTKDIAALPLVEGEYTEVDPDQTRP